MPLITSDERARLQETVGSRQTVVAASIARLHLASPDPKAMRKNDPNSILRTFRNLNNEEWTFTNVVGALVFIIDRSSDAFIFQIYDLQNYSLRFEYELYEDMTYEVLNAQFHSFEMEDCIGGFCFADSGEARSFLSKVMALKPSTKKTGANMLKKEKKKGFFGGFFGGGGKKNKDSMDLDGDISIGEIRMVQHQQHVGLNADGTFNMQNLPQQWKQMFKEAGIRKKDLQNPETAGAIMQVIQQQEMQTHITEMYQQDPEYQDMSEDQIEEYVEELVHDEDKEAYEKYQEELAQYYRDLAVYEAEQEALTAWEKDNAELLKPSSRISIPSGSNETGNKKSPPPALPPRKVKSLEKEAKQTTKELRQAEKVLQQAERDYRKSVRRAEKNPEQLEYERAALEAKAAAEKARKAADEAALERDKIMQEIDVLKASRTVASPKRMSLLKRASSKRNNDAAPPVPAPLPIMEEDIPPPPPPPPLPVLEAPKPPPLPKPMRKLPAGAPSGRDLLTGISGVKLNKAKNVNDRSKPATTRPKPGGIMGAIEAGVKLNKVQRPLSQLPDLKEMRPKKQNALMAKLAETMHQRRAALGDDDDSEDEWSD